MKVQILSKMTSGGLFVEFELEPDKEESELLQEEPPGELYEALMKMEEELRGSGEISESPDTGLKERSDTLSGASYVIGGTYEVRDEPASEVLIERIKAVFPNADVEEEYL